MSYEKLKDTLEFYRDKGLVYKIGPDYAVH